MGAAVTVVFLYLHCILINPCHLEVFRICSVTIKNVLLLCCIYKQIKLLFTFNGFHEGEEPLERPFPLEHFSRRTPNLLTDWLSNLSNERRERGHEDLIGCSSTSCLMRADEKKKLIGGTSKRGLNGGVLFVEGLVMCFVLLTLK